MPALVRSARRGTRIVVEHVATGPKLKQAWFNQIDRTMQIFYVYNYFP